METQINDKKMQTKTASQAVSCFLYFSNVSKKK